MEGLEGLEGLEELEGLERLEGLEGLEVDEEDDWRGGKRMGWDDLIGWIGTNRMILMRDQWVFSTLSLQFADNWRPFNFFMTSEADFLS